MNIFAIDLDPREAARALCDIHLTKMLTESAQILCSAAAKAGVVGAPYDPLPRNDPFTKWTGQSREDWEWLCAHVMAINSERMRRGCGGHKAFVAARWAVRLDASCIDFPKSGLQRFVAGVQPPPKVKWTSPEEAVEPYRAYYRRKSRMWWLGARVHAMSRIASGKPSSKGSKPLMVWSLPAVYPAWMESVEPQGDWRPTEVMIEEAMAILGPTNGVIEDPETNRRLAIIAAS
jgi:hypothetical protein